MRYSPNRKFCFLSGACMEGYIETAGDFWLRDGLVDGWKGTDGEEFFVISTSALKGKPNAS